MASTFENAVVTLKQIMARSGFGMSDLQYLEERIDTYDTATLYKVTIPNRYNWYIQDTEDFYTSISDDKYLYKCNGLSPEDFFNLNVVEWSWTGVSDSYVQGDYNDFINDLKLRQTEITPVRNLDDDFFDNLLCFQQSNTVLPFSLYIGTSDLRALDITPNNNIYLKLWDSTGSTATTGPLYIPIIGLSNFSGTKSLQYCLPLFTTSIMTELGRSTYLRWNSIKYTDNNNLQFEGLTANAFGNNFYYKTADSDTAKIGFLLRKEDINNYLWYMGIDKIAYTTEEAETTAWDLLPSTNPGGQPEPEPEPEDPGSEPSGNPIKTEQGQEQNKIHNSGGTGDRTSDNIQNLIPSNVIGVSGVGTGCYALNWKQVLKVMGEIWNPNFIESLLSLTNSPASTIVSCQLYPLDLSDFSGVITKTENTVYLGNYEITFDETEFGTIHQISAINTIKAVITDNFKLENISGSFLDYEPYTKMRIYLPYVGEQEISTQHVFGKTLKIYYNIDITTGLTKAIIEVDGTPLYSWKADLAVDVPISSTNYADIKQKAVLGSISAAIKAGTGMITGGASILSGASQGISEGVSTVKDTLGAMNISSSGSTGSSLERMDPQGCYLIIEYVETAVPDGYSHIKGRPSLLTTKLENLKGEGFTQIDVSHFEISGATESEKNEIENIFKEGVIIND